MWEVIKDWDAESIQYATIDLADDGHKKTKAELVDPYYTGPADRATPSIFVVKGTGAFLITGPHPIEALTGVIGDMHDDKAFKTK